MKIQYCHPCEVTKPHIKRLIDWLIDEVVSAGGDGDGLWCSRFYHVDDLLPLVEEANKYNWEIQKHAQSIYLGRDQEGLLITNDETEWNEAPPWQQVKIWY